jgi:hypothetical protein
MGSATTAVAVLRGESKMRTVWIVDGLYLRRTTIAASKKDGFAALRTVLSSEAGPLASGYFVTPGPDARTETADEFTGWIATRLPLGPEMRVHFTQSSPTGSRCPCCGHLAHCDDTKGVIVELVTLLLKLAAQDAFDRVILTAGDPSLEEAVAFVRRDLRKEFWLYAARPHVPMELLSYADRVLWLDQELK